jgi:RHS repeat-associated protein
LGVTNTSAAAWQAVTSKAVSGTTTNTVIGNVYVPKTAEVFTYDFDGNLSTDGRWTYSWDAENRLLQMVPLTNDPATSKRRLTFSYDYRSRRITKQSENWDTNSSVWTTVVSNKFCYDGWNLLADLNGTNNTVIRDYMWGTDLSGTRQGAGGVGGLLKITYVGSSTTNSFVAFDGNGNVGGLVDATDGSALAQYEYGPFGEVIRATGPMAKLNPFRFSTKYQDDETDLLYYGKRYLKTSTGGWINRDPIEEKGGNNLYCFVANCPVRYWDLIGLDFATWCGFGPCYSGLGGQRQEDALRPIVLMI